ncbi:hypothetical protein WO83_13795 [Listeria monocytogenes]|nr:hypothetical protein [Listeria monocytogenes]EAC6449950.1 hypothetical protein [Listeria monocytogenes]EAC9201346.1 hypothetical protein [Listeria monocytogenes]EAC9862530.1 hypothetical protein [Listeria monocytogenes]EAD0294055.1 hypothetical protein [Listeria monocytogenes]
MEKTYWYNEGTDTLLTEKEYEANVKTTAKNFWEDVKDDKEEQEAKGWYSIKDVEQSLLENESDFILSDSEGNKLEEW